MNMKLVGRVFHALISTSALCAIAGCHTSGPRANLLGADASEKIPGIEQASRRDDSQSLTQLVNSLESDDSAVRLYAIHALKRRTGHTMGYHYYDDDAPRQVAVQRWRDWLQAGGAPTTEPQ